ncbi:hypothetical protein NCCP2222_31850 [Sporosarcina sp. NCCP-2222]|uniref:NIPSNAP family protein n=1 Tax=Sporosarcina sp. NCCP-2222 TaxID=2935073 RepID=UPI00208476B2|nr:NIPSNAP family protein [Sporosarcina sp. NCCP-2222]GKV57238.1 hypothetical protein NCCP2222_31850 [Sporosarcina sp. NCCP-2222]
MFHRRKSYIVKNEFVEELNSHFINTNLPNQLKHGSKLVGRWMVPWDEETTEIFAIWEYESYEAYKEIETKIRADQEHVNRIVEWYERNGGRDHVLRHYLVEVKDEQLLPTVN